MFCACAKINRKEGRGKRAGTDEDGRREKGGESKETEQICS